ncbi:hypothetical protein GHR37_19265 [Achromobacter xylosoxidans]|jgi:hypothetical protein|uniref:hypothetical protein n=1 Tax=Achromobacter TaxID=222 RepID=UPI0011B1CAE3|nr:MULTISPECIES: hypothetical protein [Achromobacter]MBO9331289.1 hypothetical protein [Achromobacter xylosoxidans]
MTTGVIRLNGYRLEYELRPLAARQGFEAWVRTAPHHQWTRIGVGDSAFISEDAALKGIRYAAGEISARRLQA